MKYTTLLLNLALSAALLGCDDPNSLVYGLEHVQNDEHEEPLYPDTGTIWSQRDIPVCWENNASSAMRAATQIAVKNSWERYGNINFTGWGACHSNSRGIRIRVSEDGPHVDHLGNDLDGDQNGMELNFTFNEWSTSCRGSVTRCVQLIAVHEFGHALGFAHEQNRSDTPTWCDDEQGSDGDVEWGLWDSDSVMNYCNPNWTGDGLLSATDISGLRYFYGHRTTHQPKIVDTNADGRSDVIFVGQNWSGTGLNIRSKLSRGNGYWTSQSSVLRDGAGVHLNSTLSGDFNGDGATDLAFVGQGWSGAGLNIRTKLSNRKGGWLARSQVLGDGPNVHKNPTLVGDINGDGKDDLVFVGQDWGGNGLNIRTKFSIGNGTWSARSQIHPNLDRSLHRYPTHLGDIDGDGRADLLFVRQRNFDQGLELITLLSRGDGRWRAVRRFLGDGLGVHLNPALTGDINNDGCMDIVFVGQGWSGPGLNIRSKISRCDGSWTARSQVLGDGADVHKYRPLMADISGDGRDDIVFVGQGWSGFGLNIRTKISQGNGNYTSRSQVLGDGSGVHTYPTLLGDVNGDGKQDLIFVGQDWNGAGLNIRTKLSTGTGSWSSRSQVLGDGAAIHEYPAIGAF